MFNLSFPSLEKLKKVAIGAALAGGGAAIATFIDMIPILTLGVWAPAVAAVAAVFLNFLRKAKEQYNTG